MSAPQSPSQETSNKPQTSEQNVNLSEAIQLICHAGYPDPRMNVEIDQTQVLQRVIDTLCTLSMHDGLTGLSNQRYFKIALQREVHRARRDGTPCILLMLDIDHFKKINDQYGHPEGDRVLEIVAKRLKQELRPGDTLSRYGGEEFAVILPNCPLKYAVQVAERLRKSISEEKILIREEQSLSVTLSIGAAEMKRTTPPDAAQLLKAADENLYKAKTGGRNQCYYEAPLKTEVSPDERSALFQKEATKKSSTKKSRSK